MEIAIAMMCPTGQRRPPPRRIQFLHDFYHSMARDGGEPVRIRAVGHPMSTATRSGRPGCGLGAAPIDLFRHAVDDPVAQRMLRDADDA